VLVTSPCRESFQKEISWKTQRGNQNASADDAERAINNKVTSMGVCVELPPPLGSAPGSGVAGMRVSGDAMLCLVETSAAVCDFFVGAFSYPQRTSLAHGLRV